MRIDAIQDGYRFRTLREEDKDRFMELWCESSHYSEAYKNVEGLADLSWREILGKNNIIYLMVFRLPEEFVASCCIQDIREEVIRLGYRVVPQLRGQGIGTEMVQRLIALTRAHFPGKGIEIRVRQENLPSRRVAEKCGGKLIGTTDTPETVYYQAFLDKSREALEPQHIIEIQGCIDRGKDGVVIYEV